MSRSGLDQPRHSLIHFTNIASLVFVVLTHQQAQELIPIRQVGAIGSLSFFCTTGLSKLLAMESNERQQWQQCGLLRPAICLALGIEILEFQFDSIARTFATNTNLELFVVVVVDRTSGDAVSPHSG